jgi:Protein of unknown function (DUF805)
MSGSADLVDGAVAGELRRHGATKGGNGLQEILFVGLRPGEPEAMVAEAYSSDFRQQHHPGLCRHGHRPLRPASGVGPFSGIFTLLAIIPAIMVYIKRFHDRDKSGWWVLIALIPIIGALCILIELGFLPGTPGPNRFGPPPSD